MKFLLLLSIALIVLGSLSLANADFEIKDKDVVVIMGDSITAAQTYSQVVERYTLLRYPARRVKFCNAGIGGDTMTGGLARLDRDVFARKATLLTLCFGVNDIGWGMRGDQAHVQAYYDSLREIIRRCKAHGVRVVVLGPTTTPIRKETTWEQVNSDLLSQMGRQAFAIAKEMGEKWLDLRKGLYELQFKVRDAGEEDNFHNKADGIHFTDLGEFAIAFVMLKGMGAPAEVSSVEIDARQPEILAEENCTVTQLEKKGDVLSFVRLDKGLPLMEGTFAEMTTYRWIPVPDQLGKYVLTIGGLSAGRYDIVVEGKRIGTLTADQLARGANVGYMRPGAWEHGGPWDVQNFGLEQLTQARYKVLTAKNFYFALTPDTLPGRAQVQNASEEQNTGIERLQRLMAKPRPYHFEIRPAAPEETPKQPARPRQRRNR